MDIHDTTSHVNITNTFTPMSYKEEEELNILWEYTRNGKKLITPKWWFADERGDGDEPVMIIV